MYGTTNIKKMTVFAKVSWTYNQALINKHKQNELTADSNKNKQTN